MPTTIGSHSVAAFVNPSNGDALDATVVKGNDNTLRAAYVTHDADPGVHLQSSTLASRPAAGVVGRKWLTTDDGPKVWYDTGSIWTEIGYVPSTGTAALSNVTISGSLAVDTTTLVVDDANNRVGVGTATPGVALDVVGEIRASNGLTVSGGGAAVTGNITATGSISSSGNTNVAGSLNVLNNASVAGNLTVSTGNITVSTGNITVSSGTVTATTFSGSGASLTNLPASALTGTLPALNGSALTSLTAGNLTGTLPAISGANLTSLNASNISSGTLADALLPSTFSAKTVSSAVNGVSLLNLSASGLNGAAFEFASNLVEANGGVYSFSPRLPGSLGTGTVVYQWVRVRTSSGIGYIPMVRD